MNTNNELHPVEVAIVAALVVAEAVAVVVVAVVAVWAQAQAQLQEAVKGERGRPKADKSPHRGDLSKDPTVGKNGCPTDRKSRLIRTPLLPQVHPLAVLAEQLEALPATTLRTMAGARSKRLRKRELVAAVIAC